MTHQLPITYVPFQYQSVCPLITWVIKGDTALSYAGSRSMRSDARILLYNISRRMHKSTLYDYIWRAGAFIADVLGDKTRIYFCWTHGYIELFDWCASF